MQSEFNSLPTPPSTPYTTALQSPDALKSSLQLLATLSIFYQQERTWTHHTRAALETVLSESVKGHVQAFIGADESEVKKEPTSPRLKPIKGKKLPWSQRKNNLRLKLAGIEPPIRRQPPRPSQQILEMFSALIEARVESCERVTALIKHANRADLYS